MTKHPNEELIHRAWQAVAAGDVDELGQLIGEKASWTAIGPNPWSGRHEGFNSIIDLLARVGEKMDLYDANIVDTLVSDDRVLLVYHVSAAVGDRTFETDYLLLATVEQGTLIDMWSSPMDPQAIRKFWSGVPESTVVKMRAL